MGDCAAVGAVGHDGDDGLMWSDFQTPWMDTVTDNPWVYPVIHCAGPACTAVRKEVNRWFLISVTNRFCCRDFSSDVGPGEMPVCGQQCAQKLLEQWLNGR